MNDVHINVEQLKYLTLSIEKHREGKKDINLELVFIELEKAYDRIPREECGDVQENSRIGKVACMPSSK